MIQVESKESAVNVGQERVFDYLSDFRNFSGMLPEDVLHNVVLEERIIRFDIRGLGPAGLVLDDKVPYSSIKIKGTDDTPADFTLNVSISPVNENSAVVKFSLNASMNMFIEMMAKAPLQKFVDLLAEKVTQIS